MSADLFVDAPPLLVRLDRTVDREHPCCKNIAVIGPGKAQHAGELRCENCGRHRGWMPREAFEFVTSVTKRFGASLEPIRLGDQQIGDHDMSDDRKFDNSGILFKNRDKDPNDARDRDYKGEATIGGVGYWVSGWIKEAKNGSKFLTFSFKPKAAPKPATTNQTATQPAGGAPFNDEIGFEENSAS